MPGLKLAPVALALLLAACSSTPEGGGATAGAGGAQSGGQSVSGSSLDGRDGAGGGAAAIEPGTQADLETNVGDRVFFDLDSATLDAGSRRILDFQAEWMKRHPDVFVVVEGHCDERGTREYNLALGDRRANAVRNYLIASGVDGSRITAVSFGEERPLDPGHTPAAWAENRRAVTVVAPVS